MLKMFGVAVALVGLAGTAHTQSYDPSTRIAAQKQAIKALDRIDGRWRGTAWKLEDGKRHELVQTERVGSFLDGAVKVIEGRGYEPDGRIGFNAIAIVNFDPVTRNYGMQSNAQGFSGTMKFWAKDNGFVWEAPAGPGAVIRYTAVIEGDSWHEVGERVVGEQAPVKVFEMKLKRIGDTDWPRADPVAQK